MDSKLAIIMSVYKNDKLEYIEKSLNSLFEQTYTNFHLFLQVDGYIDDETEAFIISYSKRYSNFLLEFIKENKGLAWQLNRAISRLQDFGDFEYIARMDADDICVRNRFEKQIEYFKSNENISVVGSSVVEFDNNGSEFEKIMPVQHTTLSSQIIKRCPFNHPSVMFNLSVLDINDLVYDEKLTNTQDYYLWVDLLAKGYLFGNTKESLLYFRIDENFHSRRGLKKAINDTKSRLYALNKLNVYSFSNLFHILCLFILRISPSFVKKFAYNNLR